MSVIGAPAKCKIFDESFDTVLLSKGRSRAGVLSWDGNFHIWCLFVDFIKHFLFFSRGDKQRIHVIDVLFDDGIEFD